MDYPFISTLESQTFCFVKDLIVENFFLEGWRDEGDGGSWSAEETLR